MQTLIWKNLTEQQRQAALTRPAISSSLNIQQAVDAIRENVLANGDKALFELSEKFDKVKLDNLVVSKAQIQAASDRLSDELKQAIQNAKSNIEKFHTAQIPQLVDIETQAGVRCQVVTRPINRVGLYIPGGSAPLFSTVLMLAIPAKIAGCKKVVLCSPPPIADAILYAADLCGVETIYQVGGAQAIVAMAFGTETVAKVDKIFGPGNSFVTEAKRQVSQSVNGAAIDMQAGPSEVLVLADENADPEFVASDLLSQAEHGADSQVILVTPSETLAKQTTLAIENQLAKLPRKETACKALEHSRIFIAESLEQAVEISNEYAPEHLVVQVENARSLLDKLDNAGSIFLGAYSPESMGDYASGTNHVLPTYGYTRTTSSLGLADFSKRMTVQELTPQGFKDLAKTVEVMAAAEQLEAHKQAVSIRLNKLSCCALCKKVDVLKDSHFLPKAIYRRMNKLKKSGTNIGVIDATNAEQPVIKPLSIQIKQFLLCNDCEQLFSQNGEDWFFKVTQAYDKLDDISTRLQKFSEEYHIPLDNMNELVKQKEVNNYLLESMPILHRRFAENIQQEGYKNNILSLDEENKLRYFVVSILYRGLFKWDSYSPYNLKCELINEIRNFLLRKTHKISIDIYIDFSMYDSEAIFPVKIKNNVIFSFCSYLFRVDISENTDGNTFYGRNQKLANEIINKVKKLSEKGIKKGKVPSFNSKGK